MLIDTIDFASLPESARAPKVSNLYAIRLAMVVMAGCRWSSAENRDQSS